MYHLSLLIEICKGGHVSFIICHCSLIPGYLTNGSSMAHRVE
jgi:hypothetical protein